MCVNFINTINTFRYLFTCRCQYFSAIVLCDNAPYMATDGMLSCCFNKILPLYQHIFQHEYQILTPTQHFQHCFFVWILTQCNSVACFTHRMLETVQILTLCGHCFSLRYSDADTLFSLLLCNVQMLTRCSHCSSLQCSDADTLFLLCSAMFRY